MKYRSALSVVLAIIIVLLLVLLLHVELLTIVLWAAAVALITWIVSTL